MSQSYKYNIMSLTHLHTRHIVHGVDNKEENVYLFLILFFMIISLNSKEKRIGLTHFTTLLSDITHYSFQSCAIDCLSRYDGDKIFLYSSSRQLAL